MQVLCMVLRKSTEILENTIALQGLVATTSMGVDQDTPFCVRMGHQRGFLRNEKR